MFSSKFTGKVKDSLTDYLDKKFDDYRGQIALDLSRGLAVLAGLIAILSLVIVSGVFLSVALALLLGWLLSLVWAGPTYIISFLLVSTVLFGGAYYMIKHKERYIEEPVFKAVSKVLRSPAILAPKEATTAIPEESIPVHVESMPITESKPLTPEDPNAPMETRE